MITDFQLQGYVDQVFMRYDLNYSGTLDVNELGLFFNDIFGMMNFNYRLNHQQAYQFMMQVDRNMDGRANKRELFMAVKLILNQQGYYTQQQPMMGGGFGQQPMMGGGFQGGMGGGMQGGMGGGFNQGGFNQGGFNQGGFNQGGFGQGGYGNNNGW